MTAPDERPTLRIGELSRRVGVSDHLLRAWATRYGLLHPSRSNGGYRLYSEADADRIRRMKEHLAAGLLASEAASAVRAECRGAAVGAIPSARVGVTELFLALQVAMETFDDPAAQAVLDHLLSAMSLATVLRDVV